MDGRTALAELATRLSVVVECLCDLERDRLASHLLSPISTWRAHVRCSSERRSVLVDSPVAAA